MSDVLQELGKLHEEELNLEKEIFKARNEQFEMCKKELLGKCFCFDRRGEYEYGYYVYFSEAHAIASENNVESINLTAVMVCCDVLDVDKTHKYYKSGRQVGLRCDSLTNWMELLQRDDAQEIRMFQFADAKEKAEKFINEHIETEEIRQWDKKAVESVDGKVFRT